MPASEGERQAARGYMWQYDQLASRVYDALLEDTFESLRLVDPDAGTVDDLVLVTTASTIGHQFKSQEFARPLTLGQLLAATRSAQRRRSLSLLRELAEGWLALLQNVPTAQVVFATNRPASTTVRLGERDDPNRPSPDHFAAFLRDVAEPVRVGTLDIGDVPAGWQPTLARIKKESGLSAADFATFMGSLHIQVGLPSPLQTPDSTRRRDISELSSALFRTVANSPGVVTYDREQILALVGWTDRIRLRSSHEFPIDFETYEPLEEAVEALGHLLDNTRRGYIAIVGPPGSGKSTLLTQVLTGRDEHLVRYYAYVPRGGASRNRLEARGFLHDVTLMMQRLAGTRSGHLLDESATGLRTALHDHLDQASRHYSETGTKTIVVVDGLDHVQRDHPGVDSLLSELPRPEELHDGVIFVVGSRTLEPVHPETREHIERDRLLDLADHRLTHGAVLSICRQLSATLELGDSTHERISELAAGHPLSLAYLLNRMSSVADPAEALEVLADAVPYEGDITSSYRAIWDGLDSSAQELLAVVARLRIPFVYGDLVDWFGNPAARGFRTHLAYLFRPTSGPWSVFHDSFRQYVVHRSNLDESRPITDPSWDEAYHSQVAQRCRDASRLAMRWEELYHRHHGGQEIGDCAFQALFREQIIALRAPELISEDITIALRDAATRRDPAVFTALLFAKAEFEERLDSLEQVDVTGAYLDAQLPDNAVAFSGIDHRRQISLSQAYDLAARLGFLGNPDGRRVFDAVDGRGFDTDLSTPLNRRDDAYEAWATAAPIYRPLPNVLGAALAYWPRVHERPEQHQNLTEDDGPSLNRFHLMALAICQTLVDIGRYRDLDYVETMLSDLDMSGGGDDEEDGHARAILLDIRLAIVLHRSGAAATEDEENRQLEQGLRLTSGPMFFPGLFDWALVALDLGHTDWASGLINRRPLDREITASDVGYGQGVDLRTRFDHWRARHRIHRRSSSIDADSILEPVAPSDEPQDWAFRDAAAEELAARVDQALRTLAAIAAATDEGTPYDTWRLWEQISPIMSIGHRSPESSATLSGIRQSAQGLLPIVVDIAVEHGPDTAQQLADRLEARFREEPEQWITTQRVRLAARFSSLGFTPSWYRASVAEYEAELLHGDFDINGRLEAIIELVGHHATLGQTADAQRLAEMLIPMSFGVGYRKDYQFERWTEMFDAAVTAELPDVVGEATRFAQVLCFAAPMTEGAPRKSAATLLRTMGRHRPGLGVALLEYFVRRGTVDHLEALGELVAGLAGGLNSDAPSLRICADLVTDVLAAASSRAIPDAARAVAEACRAGLPSEQANEILAGMESRLTTYPLPTTRSQWLDAIGANTERPTPAPEYGSDGTYGHLRLIDGRSLSKSEAKDAAADPTATIGLRGLEVDDSSFNWVPVLERFELGTTDLAAMTPLFDGTQPNDSDAVVLLGSRWLEHGEAGRAHECATQALSDAHEDSWTRSWSTTRRSAHELAIAAGDEADLRRAWGDLADSVSDKPWQAGMVLDDLSNVLAVLKPEAGPVILWQLVREHLDGMLVGDDLDAEDPLQYQPSRWWVESESEHIERMSEDDTAAQALGVLVIDHATHPAWRLRDPSIATGAANINAPNSPIARAIDTMFAAGAPDDVVETLGRIAYFAEPDTSDVIARIHAFLGISENAFVRNLSHGPNDSRLPLPRRYGLAVPPIGNTTILGAPGTDLFPFGRVVERLAEIVGIDREQLLGHAHVAMRRMIESYPSNGVVRDALEGASLRMMWSSPSTFLVRTVVGRMIRDFEAAGYLDDLEPRDQRLLVSFDPLLVGLRPGPRPILVPSAPLAGHDQTLATWIQGTTERLSEYIRVLDSADGFVIAATARTTVLNWGHLEETFTTVTAIGPPPQQPEPDDADPPSVIGARLSNLTDHVCPRPLTPGHLLAIRNQAWRFHQLEADWLSFSPEVAASLGWTPVHSEPGAWLTASGEAAVSTIMWVDGWWGHAGPAFDDTEADGALVVVTPAGLNDLCAVPSAIGRVSRLERTGRDSNSGAPQGDKRIELISGTYPC